MWIEIYIVRFKLHRTASLPARGVWIEMSGDRNLKPEELVTPRKGSVD